jgi:acyl-coenzyme A synthetase/AMP-(fatty) acid ligase
MAGSGEVVSFAALEAAANRGAHLLRRLGLQRGDVFALWSGNNARFLEIAWTMRRTGLYMTTIASKFNANETSYILNDSKARVLILDAGLPHAAALVGTLAQRCPDIGPVFTIGGDLAGAARWERAISGMPATLIPDASPGQTMIYSSGTTGKPKGVVQPLPEGNHDQMSPFTPVMLHRYKSHPGSTFLVSAPLYHAGPLAMAMAEQSLGAGVLVFEKFDAAGVLAAIEHHRPERAQFVPTMFVRMLKLPPEVRARYDVSSLKVAIHSAAPCPIDAKREMIAWWGPILEEIYGGTENAGATMISSEEWLRKPGSVGRAVGSVIHICDDQGNELPVGATGVIYFESAAKFRYLNDPEKSLSTRHPQHLDWATFGDIGRMDEDGYLFLSDRKAFMIIAGGVNIYPQEVEDALAMHPAVADVAVFGIPDSDMGEQVKAVVQPTEWAAAGPALEAELIRYCKSKLATLKCPRSIDFEPSLPRDATGKLLKKPLRDRYWTQTSPAAPAD